MINIAQSARNLVMASYCTFLFLGHTLMCKSIKVDTAKAYLKAAVKLFPKHDWDPTLDVSTGIQSQRITDVFHEARRWESMPNRQEPLTVSMVSHLSDIAVPTHEDSPEKAMADWAALGLLAGFRSSEWCQPHSNLTMPLSADITLNCDGTTKAFIAEDFTLLDKRKRPIAFTNKTTWSQVEYVNIRWRFQKNGDNGQIITWKKTKTYPKFCPVRAVLSILMRANRLNIKPGEPIAVVVTGPKGRMNTSYITSALVSKHLQQAAKAIYCITNKRDLVKFSPHSFRVGACVLLFNCGKQPTFIKKRLRWRSNAFEDYLRNVIQLAKDHTAAICEAIANAVA